MRMKTTAKVPSAHPRNIVNSRSSYLRCMKYRTTKVDLNDAIEKAIRRLTVAETFKPASPTVNKVRITSPRKTRMGSL